MLYRHPLFRGLHSFRSRDYMETLDSRSDIYRSWKLWKRGSDKPPMIFFSNFVSFVLLVIARSDRPYRCRMWLYLNGDWLWNKNGKQSEESYSKILLSVAFKARKRCSHTISLNWQRFQHFVSELNGMTNFTVLAPTNDAWLSFDLDKLVRLS